MKKQIYSIIAVAMAVTVWHAMPAFAAKIDVGGEVRARGYIVQSQDFTDDGDTNWLDVRARLTTHISQGMTTGVFQIDLLGNSSATGGAVSNNGTLILGNATGTSYNLVGVRQAYLAVKFPNATLIGGRYEVKLGNGLVLNDTSDIIAVTAPIGPVNLLVGYLVLAEDDASIGGAHSAASSAADGAAFAVNAGLKNLADSGWDANLFIVSVHTNADPDEKLQVIGVTGDGKVGPANIKAEADFFTGDATSSVGFEGTNFILLGSLPVGPVGLNGGFLYATGQEAGAGADANVTHIDGDFRASNILIRDDFNNYEGISGLGDQGATGDLGLQAIKVAATLQTFKFAGMSHTPEIGLVWAQTSEDDADGDSDLGTELYVNTNCVHDENLSSNIGIAFLSAGDALVAGATDPEDQLKLEASLTFHF